MSVAEKNIPITTIIKHIQSDAINLSSVNSSFQEKFYSSILDQEKDYPLPVPVISINHNGEKIPFLTLKSFSLWQGKQKSKKTTALALAVAGFIKGSTVNDAFFVGEMSGVILFFDNEQGESYAARTMKLILKLANVEKSPSLIYCDLREFSPSERKDVIQAGIECTKDVRLVIIDGLVDLMTDFMDAGEAHITTSDILKLCSKYNIHVAGVLHQNKNDKNARAHIGTISSQKCEIEISTEVDPDDKSKSLVNCVNSRSLPFETFAIRWEKGALPCIVDDYSLKDPSDKKASKNYNSAKEIAESIFKPLVSLSHAESIKAIMMCSLKSESTAKRFLKDLLNWELIYKGPDGNYRINNNTGFKGSLGSNDGS